MYIYLLKKHLRGEHSKIFLQGQILKLTTVFKSRQNLTRSNFEIALELKFERKILPIRFVCA